MEQTALRSVSDGELITKIIDGDSLSFVVLFERYLPLIHKMGRQYYFQDVNKDDWEQEARIVLWRTIRRYNQSRGVAFSYYYKLNLRNHAYDLIRHENAAKRVHADQRVNIEGEECDNRLVDANRCPPDDYAICKERMRGFWAACSPFEREIFTLIHRGLSSEQTAELLKCDYRRVTSALDRCRRKLSQRD